MDKQHTILKAVSLSGIGIHTGNKANITLMPAEADSGINFIRVDLPNKPQVKATVENVLDKSTTMRCSCIGKGDAHIYTVEHLLSALYACSIDNLIVEIDNNEIPGMDGSANDFVNAIMQAGVKELDKLRQYYTVKEPVYVEDGSSSLIVLPANKLKVSYTLNYNHVFLKPDLMEFEITPEILRKEVISARTFCLEEEAEMLQKQQGLGKGANYTNTLVVGKNGVIKNTLRYENEFTRHKILDMMGDLYLFGQPIIGSIIALKSGHALNIKLLKKLDQQRSKTVPSAGNSGELDVNEIMKILPHREPFLFVDRIISLEPGKRIVGIKNVTINDYFFRGHFPGKPVMPGVIIIEAMAQVGGVMMLALEENKGKIAYFMSINNAKFRKTVLPGDQLVFKVEAVKVRSKTGQVRGEAYVGDKVVAEADLMFVMSD